MSTTPETYTPTPVDLAWARMVIEALRDDGIWGHPEIGAIYRIDHKAKTFTLIDAEPGLFLRDGLGFELYEKTKAVFAAVGYKVRVNADALADRDIVFDPKEFDT